MVRALAPHNVARALRMASLMTTLGLPTYPQTHVALLGACARQHRATEAHDLYWCAPDPVRPLTFSLSLGIPIV